MPSRTFWTFWHTIRVYLTTFLRWVSPFHGTLPHSHSSEAAYPSSTSPMVLSQSSRSAALVFELAHWSSFSRCSPLHHGLCWWLSPRGHPPSQPSRASLPTCRWARCSRYVFLHPASWLWSARSFSWPGWRSWQDLGEETLRPRWSCSRLPRAAAEDTCGGAGQRTRG